MYSVLLFLIFQGYIRLLEQAFSHVSQSRSWSISHASFCTFLLASATLVTSLGPRLGGRIVGLREPKAQVGELGTNCNSSSFLKSVMKISVIMIRQMHSLTK